MRQAGLDVRERAAMPSGPFLVAGLGRAGCSALAALQSRERRSPLVAWDGRPGRSEATAALRAAGVEVLVGHHLAGEAVACGAALVKSPGMPMTTPAMQVAVRRGVPVLDELELGWRLTDAPVIAVTGTNGKSTTSRLVADALAANGVPVALAGNVDRGPSLSALAPGSGGWIVSEVSSYQLEGAPGFLPDVAVLTNLSHDHLHRHGGMRRYGEVKSRMFVRGGRMAGVSIVNVDDRFGRRLARVVEGHGGAVVRFGRARDADYRLESASWTMGEARLRLATPRGRLALRSSLPGWHNAYNVAAALAVTDALALDTSATLAAVDGFSAPDGRWRVVEEGQPFDVVVDLAHSPASVAAFMLAARRILADRGRGRLLVLTGAAGGRLDPAKRYKTGRLIGLLADRFTLTTGDPHGAPPGPALDALAAGAAAGGRARVEVEVDRRAAIAKALRSARAGDIVGILGRGAMDRLVLDRSGSHTIPFDDASVAGEALLEASA